MTTLSFERPIEPIIQVKCVWFAVIFRHMEIGEMNFKALILIASLQRALKLLEIFLLDLIIVIGRQHIKHNFLVFFDSSGHSWSTIERRQIMRQIQQSRNVNGSWHADGTRRDWIAWLIGGIQSSAAYVIRFNDAIYVWRLSFRLRQGRFFCLLWLFC